MQITVKEPTTDIQLRDMTRGMFGIITRIPVYGAWNKGDLVFCEDNDVRVYNLRTKGFNLKTDNYHVRPLETGTELSVVV
jgi:hypothetical protein